MSAAITAHDLGARVLLIDRSLIGRGGATVMAQMTVAAALGEETPDDWRFHYADTLKAGRGLCDEELARLLCESAPAAILELDKWHMGWARHADGRMRQAEAPGHDRPRCVYVDFLNTGPALSRTLRAQVQRRSETVRVGDLRIVGLVKRDGAVCGALGYALSDASLVNIGARAVILSTGGLTRLYKRNSASANMGGDGYALALKAGAELIDMEFVQFFPIGHLAPRLIGMDPIMWDPFRYKLGGQLLNADGEEFIGNYDLSEDGRYRAPRDVATYAILKEVKAGRGSPAGGVYLSFKHVPTAKLEDAFGPVIRRLKANGIDLTRQPVEVAPIAHYHMGGIRVDASMQTSVPGLFAAGEAVGGANGANRLSGNAITEALVFGRRAGLSAIQRANGSAKGMPADATEAISSADIDDARNRSANPAALIVQLQNLMDEFAGPFRTEAGLKTALDKILGLRRESGEPRSSPQRRFDTMTLDALDLDNMLLVAEAVVSAALNRRESRGAHQREDYPQTEESWTKNQIVRLQGGRLVFESAPVRTGSLAR